MGRSFWDQKAILPWPLAPGPGRGPAHSGHHNKLETATYMRIHMEAYRYSRLEAGQDLSGLEKVHVIDRVTPRGALSSSF